MYAVTAAEMQAMDRETIDTVGLPGVVLMEHAGTLAAAAALAWLEEARGRQVVVLCGTGNNGGDGFVLARHLRAAGAEVAVFLAGHPTDVGGDAHTHMQAWCGVGGAVHAASEITGKRLAEALADADLVVDALLGTGLSKPLKGTIAAWVGQVNKAARPVLAMDLPSGIHADTGQVLGAAVRADLTVTFGLPKRGHFLGPGLALSGRLVVADIGIPAAVVQRADPPLQLITAEVARGWLPDRPADAHKGTFGHVLVAGGGTGMTGAVVLAATGALKAGAGLVTAAVPARFQPVVATRLTEVMTLALPETADGHLAAAAGPDLLSAARERSVTVFGPGLSRDAESFRLAREFVTALDGPLVLDADGLNAWEGHMPQFPKRPLPTVLTPHPGEMARLLGVTTDAVQADRVAAALQLAREVEAVVVLKGAQTVVADPFGKSWINTTGGPALATGGTGDVLAGMIGALLAQGLAAVEAAALAVYLHGLAADLWAETHHPAGLAAGELARRLPATCKRLLDGEVPEPFLCAGPLG
ncbi:MAG: NAD(P)H-hydrate dehydratase [Nitrospirota bacterium]|nr:NAD(P)H-hydrate dehydratase [Nitrospirota bacterium]